MFNSALANGTRIHKPAALPLSLVAADLVEVERIYDDALAPFAPASAPIVQHLKHYRGKRLRPALVLLAGHACGTVTRAHHILGAVVEMIHTATLVHDDVLDEADTRRHLPTVNAAWGTKTSLLLGDMLFSAAFRLCSTVDATACEWIGDATNRVCAGELLQVSRAGDLDLSEEDYFEIVAGKTGGLDRMLHPARRPLRRCDCGRRRTPGRLRPRPGRRLPDRRRRARPERRRVRRRQDARHRCGATEVDAATDPSAGGTAGGRLGAVALGDSARGGQRSVRRLDCHRDDRVSRTGSATAIGRGPAGPGSAPGESISNSPGARR